ncbi:MAG: pyridoxal-phosphate dependent enzyme [Bacteroidetes bacterium]|nr:pyridoxal-phosphate dependent enzyme [Bacteroidota bacterium]MBS1539137.1 pyridoxal-phosphate dependent enzyme [Bacteroidota bacterium]
MDPIITRSDIEEAHERIKPYIHRTPVLTSHSIDELAGCSLFFKCENFQNVGAFKARGATNAALNLPADLLAKGLATHSSGNHAQAIARAAKILNVKSYIVMPRTAPEIKKRGVRAYGGEIFECEPTLAAREETLAQVISKTGATEIHPFNNYDVIIGQATAAKELFEEIKNINMVLAPVGGGGLLSGTAYAANYFSPDTVVIAAEPAGSDDAYRSLKSGRIEPAQSQSIADGLLTTLGDKPFAIIKSKVAEVITVSDEEILAAMRLVWERLKIVIEPSAAVPVAAVLKVGDQLANQKVGIILSGGNVDLEKFSKLLSS